MKPRVSSYLKQPGILRRLLMAVLGVLVCGLSVGLFSYSDFGMDPFQVMAHGTWNLVPLDYGTYYVIITGIFLVVIFFVDKRKIGIGTLINLFLVGYMAEFSEWCLRSLFGSPSLALRIVSLALGIVIMCFASAVYFTADMGVSSYDAVAIIISEHEKKVPFRFVRILTDLICVIVGVLCGAKAGIGTIVTAFFMGPLISFFKTTVAEPMRYGHALKHPEDTDQKENVT